MKFLELPKYIDDLIIIFMEDSNNKRKLSKDVINFSQQPEALPYYQLACHTLLDSYGIEMSPNELQKIIKDQYVLIEILNKSTKDNMGQELLMGEILNHSDLPMWPIISGALEAKEEIKRKNCTL
jgi:hypothetical protein